MCAGPESIYTGVEEVCVQALRVYCPFYIPSLSLHWYLAHSISMILP